MCGVSAEFSLHPNAKDIERNLARTLKHLARRGPDGSGIWISRCGRAGLGHTRLSIIDITDRAAQPMVTPDSMYAISFNGEVYNYIELRKLLENKGHEFKSSSDSEVLLKMYVEYGSDMFSYLEGMYAFVIWDEVKQSLVAARDPYGIKPLYIAQLKDHFVFSSTFKSILADPRCDLEINDAAIEHFKAFGHALQSETISKNICAVPAGSILEITSGGEVKVRKHSDIFEKIERRPKHSCVEREMNLSAAIENTVRKHLVSDVPIGILLSGGVDSTLISEFAVRNCTSQLTALTILFEGLEQTPFDEVERAATIADALGLSHKVRKVSVEEVVSDLPQIIRSMDLPSTDGVNTWFAAKFAAELGIKVVLSGVGGDEHFYGYPSFKLAPRLYKICRFLEKLPLNYINIKKISEFLLRSGILSNEKIKYLLARPGSLEYIWGLVRCIDPQKYSSNNFDQILKQISHNISSPLDTVQALEIEFYLSSKLLRDADWAAMAHSVELRTPLVDYRFLDELSKVPKKNILKSDLIKCIESQNLRSLMRTPKVGFQVPYRDWLNRIGHPVTGSSGIKEWAEFVLNEYKSSLKFLDA
ncbi:asparagine synthase (glutamine-hydrolyzing) [Rhodobacterales bacterium LSUCC0387]|nr:asparagine synthase (glutamine-hydrolyzing) [Rhodobacterales bacterium LSUCC0387]